MSVWTKPSAPLPTKKELSSEPFGFKRARPFRLTLLIELKPPATRILPAFVPTAALAGYKASASTKPSAPEPGLKVRSSEPSVFMRAMRKRETLFTAVKSPTRMDLPSTCTVTAETVLFAPGVLLNGGCVVEMSSGFHSRSA